MYQFEHTNHDIPLNFLLQNLCKLFCVHVICTNNIFHVYMKRKSVFQYSLLNHWFHNFLCFFINRDFYIIIFWMHHKLFLQLIAIIFLIFHVLDFLRLFLISLKYGLIDSEIDILQLIVFHFYHHYFHIQYNLAQKITCSCWFVIIFFLLNKVSNISNNFAFNYFVFFFQSKKI